MSSRGCKAWALAKDSSHPAAETQLELQKLSGRAQATTCERDFLQRDQEIGRRDGGENLGVAPCVAGRHFHEFVGYREGLHPQNSRPPDLFVKNQGLTPRLRHGADPNGLRNGRRKGQGLQAGSCPPPNGVVTVTGADSCSTHVEHRPCQVGLKRIPLTPSRRSMLRDTARMMFDGLKPDGVSSPSTMITGTARRPVKCSIFSQPPGVASASIS
jgi:hypothetical protein